jgi:8-oxo-dGTP pyrophosphatase MutT (NUDIX family)
LTARRTLTTVGWIHVENGRLLNVRSIGRDAFYMPGGKIEPGESLPEALVREVREELRLSLDPATLTEAMTVHAPAHGAAGTLLRLHCFTGGASGRPTPSREIEELAWFGLDDDLARCAPATVRVLRELGRRRLL